MKPHQMNLPNACPMPPIRVSLTIRHFKQIGGLEKYAYRIAERFTQHGAHVHIITSDPFPKNESHPLIHFHYLPLKRWLNFRKMQEFDQLCQKWHSSRKADITFGMDRTRYQTHFRAGNGVHAAYIQTRKNYSPFKISLNPLNKTILQIEKEAFENPELKVLFTNSNMVKREVLEHYNVNPHIIEVVHNGVEWAEMQKDFDSWIENKQATCDKLGLDPSKFHFLFIGNGYKRKGLLPLMEALSTLPFKDFHLSVIGKDRNIQEFISKAIDLGLSDHISFFGPRSDTRLFYQTADSLVIPSFYDPFANVTVEALAMGLFVVSSKSNGGHEILQENMGTIIADLNDTESIANALATAFNHPKTRVSSYFIREKVKHLDFSNQLTTLINISLERR